MSYVVQHPKLAQPLTFEDAQSFISWLEAEREFWKRFASQGALSTHRNDAETALVRAVGAVRSGVEADLSAALQKLATLPLISVSPHGEMFEAMHRDGYNAQSLAVAYLALFKPDEARNLITNSHWMFDGMRGLGRVAAFEAGGDPQRLVNVQRVLQQYAQAWEQSLSRAQTETDAQRKIHEKAVADLQRELDAAKVELRSAKDEYLAHMEEVRQKFEERFALDAPMTYWDKKAERHEERAGVFRNWFTGTLVAGVIVLAVVAVWKLVPFMEDNPTAYWAVVMYSFALAILAWPLRIFAKQYLVHQQLREDATERSVIAETFLALDKSVKLSAEDRTLLLGTLMRPAAVPLAGDDGGSSLSIPDLLAAKTILK